MSPPLDKLQVVRVTEKGEIKVPALDPSLVEHAEFVSYQAPPTDLCDKGHYEAWMERLRFIEDDLHWLLQLPHDKFWCQAIHDETLLRFLNSYLRFAPRSSAVFKEFPVEARSRHNKVHKLVFMVWVRLATYKESKDCYITPSVFADIIYENCIFDIPKIMDLCVLYGKGNGTLLAKMIDNVFTQEPRYKDDLALTLNTLYDLFDAVLSKCGIQLDQTSQSPQKLSNTGNKKQTLSTMEPLEFKDVILYFYDIGMTLTSFLDVYPAACQSFHESDFLIRWPAFYEAVIPELLSALKCRSMDVKEKQALKHQVLQVRTWFLTVFQNTIGYCCIQPILEKRDNISERVEDYIRIMTSILSERRFLADYESFHSLQGDLEILSQASCEVDETRLQYIQDAVNSAFATFGKRKAPKGAMKRGGRRSPDGSDMEGAVGGATGGAAGGIAASASNSMVPDDVYQVEDMDELGACAVQVTGVELESLVSSVQDLLPELGAGFVELCLEEMGYSTERVINAVLEDKLPASLNDIDRTMPRKKRAVTPPSLIHQRKNIYDYDEFDVFHRSDIDTQKVRRGKLDKTKDVTIGDQTELRDIKDSISRDYGVIKELVIDDGESGYVRDIYDDEYDDTYDTNVVGADDADSADELSNIRPFTTPRVLGGQTRGDNSSSNVQYEESDDETEKQNRDHFIEDPALIRQAAEDRARWKAQRSKPAQGQTQKTHDVKGGPKGQGQSSEVLRNRRWKTQHKGDFKRAAADRKRKV